MVNDGSTRRHDGAACCDAFDLLEVPPATRVSIPTKPVRAVYRSLDHPNLIVIDKENGGKSDALNAGINVVDATRCSARSTPTRCSSPTRCCASRARSPRTTASSPSGGIVRVLNGSRGRARPGGRGPRAGHADAALPVARVRARLSRRADRARQDELPAHHLRRVRAVPQGSRARGRRLPDRHRLRGHGARGAPASRDAPPEAARAGRLRARSRLLDADPGGLDVASPAARPLAARAAREPVDAPHDVPEPALRRRSA